MVELKLNRRGSSHFVRLVLPSLDVKNEHWDHYGHYEGIVYVPPLYCLFEMTDFEILSVEGVMLVCHRWSIHLV